MNLHLIDYFLFRNVSYVICSSFCLYLMKINPLESLPKERSKTYWLGMIFLRAMAGNFTNLFLNAGFKFAPISLAYIVFQTNPFWSAMIGYTFNGEVIERFTGIGMVLAFLGVCFMSWSTMKEKTVESVEDPYAGTKFFGMVLELCAAFTFSIVTTVSRRLQPVSPFIVIFYMGLVGLICAFFLLTGYYIFFCESFRLVKYPIKTILYASAGGFTDMLAALFVTIAYASGATGFVAMLSYIVIVYAFLSDLVIFHEEFMLE